MLTSAPRLVERPVDVVLKFLTIFKQRAPYFPSVPDLANFGAGPNLCLWRKLENCHQGPTSLMPIIGPWKLPRTPSFEVQPLPAVGGQPAVRYSPLRLALAVPPAYAATDLVSQSSSEPKYIINTIYSDN